MLVIEPLSAAIDVPMSMRKGRPTRVLVVENTRTGGRACFTYTGAVALMARASSGSFRPLYAIRIKPKRRFPRFY